MPREYAGKERFDDFEPLTLTEHERGVLSDLHKASAESGFEHGAVIINGESYAFTSQLEGRVRIPSDVRAAINDAPDGSIHLLHSHTNVTPPSVVDFERLLDAKTGKMSVVANNGDVYSVSVGNGWIPTRQELDSVITQISSAIDTDILDMPGFWEWSVDERHYVRVREQSYRIARHFEWTMEGGAL